MTTGTISSNNAIDVNSIVSALMAVERQPLTRMETNVSALQSEISEFGKLQSAMDSLNTAALALTKSSTWGAATGTSSDDTAVSISATTGALRGSYAVKVNQLASPQTIVSEALGDKTAVIGGGTLSIQFAADADGATPDPIELTLGADSTLEDIASAINTADKGIGASLVTDANGTRLMLRSSESGETQGFSISATSDGTGVDASLTDLAYTIGQASGTMQETQTAANAMFELNGLALESSSNQPEGILDDISLSFRKVTDEAIDLEVETDGESVKESMDAFVTAYNTFNTLIRSQTAYDADTQTAGALQGNRMAILTQQRIRDALSGELTGATGEDAPDLSRLADIGLEFARDGSLSLDESKFAVASADISKIQDFFGANDISGGSNGFARELTETLDGLLGTDGAITGATESLKTRESYIEDQQEAFERRMEEVETRLLRQYTALDANMSVLQSALLQVQNLG